MREDRPPHRLASVLGLGLAALLCALATAARAADVTLEVQVVRASGQPSPGVEPAVSEDLAAVKLPWSRLGYGRYELDRVTRKAAAWGESVVLEYAEGGRLTLTPRAGEGDRPITLHVEQRLPGAKEPCLVTDAAVAPGQRSLQYCAHDLEGATWLFVLSGATE